MNIRFLHALAGVSVSYNVGDVAEVEDGEAARLIEAGFAAPTADAPAAAAPPAAAREKAVKPPREAR